MAAFAIVATHHLKRGTREKWAALAMVNAREARKERGCLQFDVILPREEADIGILIERYADETAWNWHFSQHYCRDFMSAIETMLVNRTRVVCDVV